jgi:hypothetical protein
MCDDHGLTRRRFLTGAAAVGAGAALQPPGLARAGTRRTRPLLRGPQVTDPFGNPVYSMAMHIHSSFSEQQGSMASQMWQAALNDVNVIWYTDHDQRMTGLDYRDVTHFTSFGETGGPGQGDAWNWQRETSGGVSYAKSGIVQNPCSPKDPVPGGALHLAVTSSGSHTATDGYYANSVPSDWNYRGTLDGQTITLDVLLDSGWSSGYVEMFITTSFQPASGGRPAGTYSLSYRFVPPGRSHSRYKSGTRGVIVTPIKTAWQTVTVNPSADIAALWPDLDWRDFALWKLTFRAASTGQPVSGYVDYLRFNRSQSGSACLAAQLDMMARLAPMYPAVTAQQGLEVSAGGQLLRPRHRH